MDDIVSQSGSDFLGSTLADVLSTPIDELVGAVSPVLEHSIRQLADDLDRPEDAIAGWNSVIE
jgi:FXSXX-COOH protein